VRMAKAHAATADERDVECQCIGSFAARNGFTV
jgi:hypothetical protein